MPKRAGGDWGLIPTQSGWFLSVETSQKKQTTNSASCPKPLHMDHMLIVSVQYLGVKGSTVYPVTDSLGHTVSLFTVLSKEIRDVFITGRRQSGWG